MSRLLCTLAVIAAIALTSCGGGDGGQTDYTLNASPGGIWVGSDVVTGLAIVGLTDELGNFQLIRADGMQIVGEALTAADALYANTEEITAFGKTFPDGATHGSGILNGTIAERSSLAGEIQFTTDAGTGAHIVFGPAPSTGLEFDGSYFESSTLAIIAGTYTYVPTGTVVTVDLNGAIFAQDATTGCVINGSVSIIEETYNVYRVQGTAASCQGAAAVLNGIKFNGLATLQDTVSPQNVIVGLIGSNNSVKYAFAYTLTRSSPPPM
jgi:hypothetical protein